LLRFPRPEGTLPTTGAELRVVAAGPAASAALALAVVGLTALLRAAGASDAVVGVTDYARSRTVAATGTIAAHGSVGAVGGVHEEAIAARDDGAQVFLVPAEELSSADGNGFQARGVEEDLGQAVQLLQAA
jgi:PDZ domain-containing protein